MLRIKLLIAMIFSIVLIVGCSNKNLVTESEAETGSSKEALGDTYGFTSFNLSIDTTEMKEALIANYDEKRDKTEAVYENKIDDYLLSKNPH